MDDPSGGPNAPCTRSKDCNGELACIEGVCRDPNAPAPEAGSPTDAGGD